MKTLLLSLLILIGLNGLAQTDSTKQGQAKNKIEAYYFHNTRRCATCKAVESVSSEALKAMSIQLQSLNIDKDENMAIAEKVGAGGQALILTNGLTSINLTNEGFMYARSNPKKLKSVIKEAVETLDKK